MDQLVAGTLKHLADQGSALIQTVCQSFERVTFEVVPFWRNFCSAGFDYPCVHLVFNSFEPRVEVFNPNDWIIDKGLSNYSLE